MKKNLLALLLGFGILLTTVSAALAENYTYKVYNPKINKAYTAVFGTVSLSDTEFLWAFFTPGGEPLCIIPLYNASKNAQGLVGGKCSTIEDFTASMQGGQPKNELSWRELNPNTLYREAESIKRERAAQGKYEFGSR